MHTSKKDVGMNMRVNSSATVNCFRPRSSSLQDKTAFPGGLSYPNGSWKLSVSQ